MLIKYFADIRELTGENERQWNKPEETLGGLLTDLADLYGPAFAQRVLQNHGGEGLSEHVIVLINGQDVRHEGGVRARLHRDDTIAIFPLLSGK